MRFFRAQTLLTMGLLAKAAAVIVAVILAWPLITKGPAPVAAQEENQKKEAPADKESVSEAASDVRKTQSKGDEAAGVSQTKPTPQEPSGLQTPPTLDPRITTLLDAKRQELDLEEARIKREREELELLRKEVDQRIAELKKVQAVLEQLVATEQKQRRERILQLVKVLSNMRPQSAAAVVEKLDDQMAVEIFKQMQSRMAGKVMAAINPQQAARISSLLTKDKESKKAADLAEKAAQSATQPQEKK